MVLVTFDVVNAFNENDVVETYTNYTDNTVGRFLNELTSLICSRGEDRDVTYSLVHINTNITDAKERQMLSHYLGSSNEPGTIRLVRNAFKPENIATPKAAPTFEPREWR